MIRRLPFIAMFACLLILGLVPAGYAQSAASAKFQTLSHSDLKEYKAAVQANPDDHIAHTKLGNWYLQAGKTNDAIKEYKKAAKLNESYATAWNNLGSAYHAKRKYKDAVKCYRKATALQPDMAVAYRNLGTALLMLSNYDECISAFQQALKLDPAILDFLPDVTIATSGRNALRQYFYFAKICAASGRIDAAIGFLKKAQAAGFADFKKVRQDPDFQAVVADARFESIVQGESH
ncbi:MAG: tetratricopeptide repeat protein [Acidobacteria bacterium]|nr:tetratricopeptide repeat protein [Acidobacteriota bacterium]